MSMMYKIAAGIVVTGLALTGCASGGTVQPTADPNAKVTLRFAWWGNDTRNKLTNEVIAKFEAANPNIKIQAEPGEWGSYWDKLATQVAGNDMPDVIQMDEKYIADYGNRGALLDLEKAGVVTTDFAPGTVDGGRTSKGLFGINAGINAPVVLANPKVLAAAGATLPDDKTWTWESHAALAAQITEKSPAGTFGSQNYGMVEPIMRVWLRQNGADEYNASGIGFTAEQLTPWFQNMLDLQEKKAFPSASEASEDLTKGVDQTMAAQGKVAMFYYWSNQVAAFDKSTGQDLAVLRPPSKTGNAKDVQLWYKPSMLWSASSQTKNKEAVTKFINFLANDVEAGKVLKTERGVPANLKVRAAVKENLGASDKKIVAYLESIESELGAPMAVTPKGGSDIQLGRFGTDVIFKRSTPAQAAEGLVTELKSKVKA